MEAAKTRKGVDWRSRAWLAFIIAAVVVCLASIWILGSRLWHNSFQQPEVVLRATLEDPRLDLYAAGEGDETVIVFTTGEKTIRVYAVTMYWFYDLEETEPEYLTAKWNGWPDNSYDDYELHLHRLRPR